jgi:NAD(P)H-dependent FMN reductase
MKLMVINGSVRDGRVSEKIEAWAKEILSLDDELELDMVDLRQVDLPFFNEKVIPSMNGGKYENPKGTAWAERVSKADAFLFITPEYNHGPTAVLKNAVDWVYEGWHYKPAGFISYGGAAAGTRAVQQLKQNLLNVLIFPVSINVHIPLWGGGMDSAGRPAAHFDDGLRKVVKSLKQLQQRLAV